MTVSVVARGTVTPAAAAAYRAGSERRYVLTLIFCDRASAGRPTSASAQREIADQPRRVLVNI